MSRIITIVAAEPHQAEDLADLAAKTFRAAFEEANSQTDMDEYIRRSFSIESTRKELADPLSSFLVACLDGSSRLSGYAKLRRSRPGPGVKASRSIELQRLYVDVGAIGSGLGAALMGACLESAAAEDHESIWLGVWEHNPRAIRFYERWGFETVGSHSFQLGSDDQTDWIMERTVAIGEGSELQP